MIDQAERIERHIRGREHGDHARHCLNGGHLNGQDTGARTMRENDGGVDHPGLDAVRRVTRGAGNLAVGVGPGVRFANDRWRPVSFVGHASPPV